MTRIAVLGSNGQLGADLCPCLEGAGYEVVRLTRADFDVCDAAACTQTLVALEPEVVINTTALHNVEVCEQRIEAAFAVNAYAVRALAQVCDRLGATMVHLSSDYVFGGGQRTPYTEEAALGPVNVYGVSKAAGEYLLRQSARRHLLIRTSGLFGLAGASGKGGNFVETMLRLGRERERVSVVMDQVSAPTYTVDLSAGIAQLLAAGAEGIFHLTNAWACSWYEFARAIFELAGLPAALQPVTTAEYGARAARPAYSVLDNARMRRGGFAPLRDGREALAAYLHARAMKHRGSGVSAKPPLGVARGNGSSGPRSQDALAKDGSL